MLKPCHVKFILLVALLLFGLTGISCREWAEKPGSGLRAEQGFAAAFPITQALENCKNDTGRYPQNLRELVPKYLEKDPQQEENSEVKFTYFPDPQGQTYRLRFTSEIPMGGTDECNFTPEDKKWNCGGKF
jgi:hypothetical protein